MIGSDLHKAALQYAAQGIPVFPCGPFGRRTVEGKDGSKLPATGKGGFHNATTDEGKINAWFEQDDYNVAFSPGDMDQTVLDVDPKNGGVTSLEMLELFNELPETYEITTPSGGRHLYFKGAVARSSAGRLGRGLDTRSTGGYVLLPPSRTDDGPYTVRREAAVVPLPPWLGEALEQSNRSISGLAVEPDLDENVRGYREFMARQPGAAEGERNEVASQYIGYAFDYGVSKRTALPIIYEWGARCRPPIPCPDEKIENHGLWLKRQNTGAPLAVSESTEAWFAKHGVELPAASEQAGFRTYTEDDQNAWREPEFLVQGLLPRTGLGAFYGSKGTFKSFLALHVALCRCAGVTMWGGPERESVVYVPYEGAVATGRIRRPAFRLAYGIDYPLTGFHIVTGKERPYGASTESLQAFVEGVRPLKPTLVVIDTLHRFMRGLSETKDEDCSRAIAALQYISEELRCVVLVCHHKPKGGETKATMRGHSSLTDDMDFVHEVVSDREKNTLALHCRFMKDADERKTPWTFELRPSGRSLALYEVEPPAVPSEFSASRVQEVLAAHEVWGAEKGIPTFQLATKLRMPVQGEPIEVTEVELDKLARALDRRARGDLGALNYGESGKTRRWWLMPAGD